MTHDLAALGLLPPDEHPDAELFSLIAKQKARHDAWRAARGDAAYRKLLLQWKAENSLGQEMLIAAFTPSTFEGLIEKADNALRDWREDESETRYHRLWAVMATTLEQATQILQAQRSVEMPVRDDAS